jgi:hypothetical protein
MKISLKKILVSKCNEGIYLRWWFNGWHYFNFTNGYEIEMQTASSDIQVSNFFSSISKIERDTQIKSTYSYQVTLHGITAENISGFTSLLMAEKVEQYEDLVWREVDITRGEHLIHEENSNGYIFDFEITRKELPDSSSVYQKSLRLYIGDILCDMDDDEIIPVNKQVNNIAELQDRQSDFTAEFKIRKTRAMKALFELSGEVGANTTFPFERQTCKLIADNIEIITGGILILQKVDDQYYYVNIMSGNISFFNKIEGLKISDLSLPSTVHTWDIATMAASHSEATPNIDFCYPLCEPSDDGSIIPLNDDGDKVELYGGWVWPFVRIKAIWDEIFSNAGFTVVNSLVIDSDKFRKLFMPIASREITDTKKYLYSMFWNGPQTTATDARLGMPIFQGITVINGDTNFKAGYYVAPFSGTYNLSVSELFYSISGPDPIINVYNNSVLLGPMTFKEIDVNSRKIWEYAAEGIISGDEIQVRVSAGLWFYWQLSITQITGAAISFGSSVNPKLHLPDMTQKEFVKMICNLFALVPDTDEKNRKITFWNYDELYNNTLFARDWSNYLSERDDEVEFKFGDFAQSNYLKFKESDDVLVDNGKGTLQIDDETLDEEKEIVELSLSTCDEVIVLDHNFSVKTSRIGFNKWNAQDSVFDSEKKIDARIIYIDYCKELASPPYTKSLWLRSTTTPYAGLFTSPAIEIVTPKVAQSLPVSFSTQIVYYASLSRLLTKPNLRRAKFNLPVYEVAGLKHNIPIYLNQYKAYFYVNKISNYVPGKLCTIELIRL